MLPIAKEMLGKSMMAFNARTAVAARHGLEGAGKARQDILEVRSLFGEDMGLDAANKAWQHGYACGLACSFLQAGGDPETFHPTLAPVQRISAWYGELAILPLDSWVLNALTEPYARDLLQDIIGFVIEQDFLPLRPLFDEQLHATVGIELRMLALAGLGLGRLQLEEGFAAKVVPMTVPTITSAMATLATRPREPAADVPTSLDAIDPSPASDISAESGGDISAKETAGREIERGRRDLRDPNLVATWRERAQAEARSAHRAALRAGLSAGTVGHHRALAIFEAYAHDLGDLGLERRGLLIDWVREVHAVEWQQAFLNPKFFAARDAYVESFILAFDGLMIAWKAAPDRPSVAGPAIEEARWLAWLGLDDLRGAAAAPARRGLKRFLPR
jgi:hypothetical protein